ncbi:MAG TPA: hypothetical protein VFQ00_02530 [Terriglobales bacterium]|nr:hypothetical protein [Terriglobales bacterium]
MPVEVKVDRGRKLVLTSFYGEVTDADVTLQISELRRHAPFAEEFRVITDFSRVEQFNISSQMIRHVAQTESPLASAKRVMVAPSDVAYGTSRMFQALASHTRPNLTVVRTLVEAYAALDLEGTSTQESIP